MSGREGGKVVGERGGGREGRLHERGGFSVTGCLERGVYEKRKLEKDLCGSEREERGILDERVEVEGMKQGI